jgi:ribosomal protein S18 acetylase RimI-like enzyme
LFRVFRNRDFAAILIKDDSRIVSQLVLFPSYYAFPYMHENDVQIGYVATDAKYRGRGLAKRAVSHALALRQKTGGRVFYIADEQNAASLSVAEPLGFTRMGVATHRRLPFLPRGLGRYELIASYGAS